MSLSPENERTVVKFLVAALGHGREQARAFLHRLPDTLHPSLMAAAYAWMQKSCAEASVQFTGLMGRTPSPHQPDTGQTMAAALLPIKKRSAWTPEMRARQSKLVKRRMKAKGVLGNRRKRTPQSDEEPAQAADRRR